jgi:hypothetical protein
MSCLPSEEMGICDQLSCCNSRVWGMDTQVDGWNGKIDEQKNGWKDGLVDGWIGG